MRGMDARHSAVFASLAGIVTFGGCGGGAYLGSLDPSLDGGTAPSGSASGACYPEASGCPAGTAPSPSDAGQCAPGVSCVPSANTKCELGGGTCEFVGGNIATDPVASNTDPCTATGRSIGSLSCKQADAGRYYCCMPAPTPPPITECSQNGGTCEFDDGTAATDPCTASSRPIGPFACHKTDVGEYFCCMPK